MTASTKHVRGVEAVMARLRKVRRTIDQFDIVPVHQLLLRRNKERFEQQVDPNEQPWKELATVTKQTKRRKGRRRKILQETGDLKASIGLIRGPVPPGGFGVATGAGVRIGIINDEVARYGRLHQQGQGVPQRRFLGVGPTDITLVDSLLKRVIIRRAGLR